METDSTTKPVTKTSERDALSVKRGLIIIPAFNEEGSIAQTVQRVMTLPMNLTVLVVNDGSTDRTGMIAKGTGAKVVSLPFNLGIGGAVQTGFIYAAKHGYDFAVQVDGDGQHDVAYLKNLVEPVLNGTSDMTIGSRFIPPYTGYQSSFIRRIGINFFSRLISVITKYRITDPTSGFRCFNKRMIRLFSRYYSQDYPEPEAIVEAGRAGATILEVPVQMHKRASGHSSIRYLLTCYYMIKVTLAILMTKIKRRERWDVN